MPIEWTTRTFRDYYLGSVTTFTGKIVETNWERIVQQLEDLWVKVVEAMETFHGPHPPHEWEALLCMIRPDGGKIFVSPIRLPITANTYRTAVLALIDQMESEYFDLPDFDDDFNERIAEWEKAHDAVMAKAFNAVSQAAQRPRARAALQRLHASHPFVTYGMHYDDRETMFDLNIP